MSQHGQLVLSLILFPLLGAAADVSAQALGGSAHDGNTGAPVGGAVVTALDAQGREHGTVVTDSLGVFHIPLRLPGRYQLRAQHAEYTNQLSGFIRVRRGESIAVDLRIGAPVTELAPLIVVARKRHPVSRLTEFYDRMERQKKIGLGRFITRADIAQTSSVDVHSVLEREPSVSIVRSAPPRSSLGVDRTGPPDPLELLRTAANVRRTGVSEVIVIQRGGGACTPMIFLDGMPLGSAEFVQLTSFVSTDEIEGIELYRSGMETPGELADACGAIGVWTRRAEGTPGNPFTWPRIAKAAGFLAGAVIVLNLIPQ